MSPRRNRPLPPPPEVPDMPCYCWRLDLPHLHTLAQCARTPRPCTT